MGVKKLSELTELTDVASNDIFLVTDVSGTATSKYVTKANLLTDTLNGKAQTITCADSVTIDWSLGATAKMVFDRASVAFSFSNPSEGKVYRLLLVQGDGSDVATWTTTIKWANKTAPTLSTGASNEDWITFIYIGSAWYGSATLNFGTV